MDELTLAKPIAPEDLARDTYVAALFIFTQHLTWAELCGEDDWRRRGVVRTCWLPSRDIGLPLRIAEICLPFLLIERPDGTFAVIDTRQVRLGRLSERFGRKAFKRLRASKPRAVPSED